MKKYMCLAMGILSPTLVAYAKNPVLQNTAYVHAVTLTAMHNLQPANLLKIPKSKPYVIMATWTNESYKPGYYIMKDNVWLTEKNELYKACTKFSAKHIADNMELLLGMPPLSNYNNWHLVLMEIPNHQATFKVNGISHGMFRPCFSTDSLRTDYCTDKVNMKLANYNSWILELSLTQYRFSGGYPWTGLGYTYNLNPNTKSIIGLSEFIVTKGTQVRILDNQTAKQFCLAAG